MGRVNFFFWNDFLNKPHVLGKGHDSVARLYCFSSDVAKLHSAEVDSFFAFADTGPVREHSN